MASAGDGMSTARYVMIGGFLGAGKSTSIGRFARYLRDGGKKVGLITNDQAAGLVDTRFLRNQGFDVEEIAGGCFCCRFDSLRTAAAKLDAEHRPDVFLAEPVGSCTDLVATVSYPLRRIYGEDFEVAPLSVVIDPARAARVLGIGEGRSFSDKVVYIYRKQLEEAQVLVINKIDRTPEPARATLRRALTDAFGDKPIFEVSARENEDLEPWFEHVLSQTMADASTIDIDYARYGEGEALLGWLNATLSLEAESAIDGNVFLEALAGRLHATLSAQAAEIAHLKMTLVPGDGWGDLALVNVVGTDFEPELAERLNSPVERAELVVNLRAEAAPELLLRALEDAIAHERLPAQVRLTLAHHEHFRPGQPDPTHRIVVEADP